MFISHYRTDSHLMVHAQPLFCRGVNDTMNYGDALQHATENGVDLQFLEDNDIFRACEDSEHSMPNLFEVEIYRLEIDQCYQKSDHHFKAIMLMIHGQALTSNGHVLVVLAKRLATNMHFSGTTGVVKTKITAMPTCAQMTLVTVSLKSIEMS